MTLKEVKRVLEQDEQYHIGNVEVMSKSPFSDYVNQINTLLQLKGGINANGVLVIPKGTPDVVAEEVKKVAEKLSEELKLHYSNLVNSTLSWGKERV